MSRANQDFNTDVKGDSALYKVQTSALEMNFKINKLF